MGRECSESARWAHTAPLHCHARPCGRPLACAPLCTRGPGRGWGRPGPALCPAPAGQGPGPHVTAGNRAITGGILVFRPSLPGGACPPPWEGAGMGHPLSARPWAVVLLPGDRRGLAHPERAPCRPGSPKAWARGALAAPWVCQPCRGPPTAGPSAPPHAAHEGACGEEAGLSGGPVGEGTCGVAASATGPRHLVSASLSPGL